MLDSTHFEHNNEWVCCTVGTSSDSRPRRHRVPVAFTQTLGLSQARPPAGLCHDFSHLFGTMNKPSSHKEAAVRCSMVFDHNDECAGLSARFLITATSFDRAHRCFSCAREKRQPWSRSLVSRKSEGGCARDGHSFWGWSIFEPKDIGLSQAVVKGSDAAVRQNE